MADVPDLPEEPIVYPDNESDSDGSIVGGDALTDDSGVGEGHAAGDLDAAEVMDIQLPEIDNEDANIDPWERVANLKRMVAARDARRELEAAEQPEAAGQQPEAAGQQPDAAGQQPEPTGQHSEATTKKTVPESLLKKAKLNDLRKKANAIKSAQQKKMNLLRRRNAFVRAKEFVRQHRAKVIEERRQHRAKVTEERRLQRAARNNGNFYVPDQAKVALVIRIKGVNKIPPKPRKIMQLFRLQKMNNATLVKLNQATIKMLEMAEPYITYGYPNLTTLRNLIYKRGYLKIDGKRTAITDNNLIEQHLRKYNIVCLEDIVKELYTVGPHFKEVNNFLWHFKLSNPRGGWRRKAHHYVEGGDYGNRETRVNNLVKRMI